MIFRLECRKLLRCPVFYGIIFLCFLFNVISLFLLFQTDEMSYREEVAEVIVRTGADLNDSSTMEKMNELQTSESTGEQLYAYYVHLNRTLYESLDMNQIGQAKLEQLNMTLPERLKKFILHCYEKLQTRVEEIKTNGEDDDAFYPGDYFQLHTALYSNLMRKLMMESGVIIVLSLLYLMDYDRIHGCDKLVYSTFTGRKAQRVKMLAGFAIGIGWVFVLMLASLLVYFNSISYEGLWDVHISSVMLTQLREFLYYPFITFVPMTQKVYFISFIGIFFLWILVMGVQAISMQLMFHNSYLSFLLLGLAFLLGLLIPQITHNPWIEFISVFNPAALWFVSSGWMIENNPFLCFAGSEAAGLFASLLIFILAAFVFWKRYLHCDIVEK